MLKKFEQMGQSEEGIQAQIARLQGKLGNLKDQEKGARRKGAIKDLSEFSIEEKAAFFDKLYNSALGVVNDYEKNKYVSEDEDNWAFEEKMGILARNKKQFWDYYNSLSK